MNSTANKSRASILCVLLVITVLLSCGCTKSTDKDFSSVDQVSATGAYVYSWMFVITDSEKVQELCDIYSSIKYEKTEASIDQVAGQDVFILSYSNGTEQLAYLCVDKNGNCMLEPKGEVYHIVSDFDYEKLYRIIKTSDK